MDRDGNQLVLSVSTFRGLADHAFQSLRKGDRVVLTGRLKVRDWEAGDRKGTSVDIEADAIGHDLRLGTTKFEKDAGTRRGDAWEAPPAPAEEWSTPGCDGCGGRDGVVRGALCRWTTQSRGRWSSPASRRRSDLTAGARGAGP